MGSSNAGGEVMSHYAEETYDVYHEIRVIARKEHECDSVLCSDPIRPGDNYWRIHTVHDGRHENIKRCIRCQLLHEHLRGLGDDMWPSETLACGLDYESEWGNPPPPGIAALAFWRPGDPPPALNLCDAEGPRHPFACWQHDWRTGRSRATALCQRADVSWEHWSSRTPNQCTEVCS
jgi:hypothetical protein